jgi:hypothetical protein
MKANAPSESTPDLAIEAKINTVRFPVEIDLNGTPKNVQLRWGQSLPTIVYDNKTGIFYQLIKDYSYCEVSGQILSIIEV